MRFALTAEQEELAKTTRRFLTSQWNLAAGLRDGSADTVWRRASRELGWAAVPIPEEHGGAGLTWVEVALLMEEMGRALFVSPFFATVCLGASALQQAGHAALLPAVAAGEHTLALAHVDQGAAVTARPAADTNAAAARLLLRGAKRFVLDGESADSLLVLAEGRLFLVDGRAPGVTRTARPTLDATRPLADVTLHDAPGVVVAENGDAIVARTLDLARIALAAEAVGGAARCLEMALDYAKVRVQFGRTIGSFQAIKHKLAEMLVEVETARSAAWYAAWVAAHEPSELASAAALAHACCSDAYFRCAAECIQIHGGIGFTWDHDAHRYFKRARATGSILGEASESREKIAASLLG